MDSSCHFPPTACLVYEFISGSQHSSAQWFTVTSSGFIKSTTIYSRFNVNLYFNNPFDQCAQCQNKAVRAAALTIFSKMGAKNREHNECILMTLFALWEEGIFAKNEQEIILTAKHSCKAGTFYTPSNEQWCIFIISCTVKIYKKEFLQRMNKR